MDYKDIITDKLVEIFKKEDIDEEGVYPEIELLKEIVARSDAVVELRKSLSDPKYWEEGWKDSGFYVDVMYLLGIIKTKESFELLREMLIKHNEELHEADFITEDLSAVWLNFGDEYFNPLAEITKDTEYDEYVRAAAFGSLCAMAFLNNKFKSQLIELSKTLFEDRYVSKDFPLLVLHDMADLKDKELFDKVLEFEEKADIGEYRLTSVENLEETYNSMTDGPECLRNIRYLLGHFASKKRHALYHVKEATYFSKDDEEKVQEDGVWQTDWSNKTYWIDKGKKVYVGRNDKCPCGSGIKYKKCHGKPT